jgi:hypothetical protein
MASTSTNRRRFLLGLGAAGAGGSALLSLLAQRARAQAVTAPRRLLVIYMPNCNQTRYWVPTGGAYPEMGTGVATDYSLNQGNEAFAAVKDRMTLINGINVSVNGGDLHSNAQIRFMTGKPSGAGSLGTVPSIDQLLIDGSPALQAPPFKSVELICDTRSDRNDLHHRIISYGMDAKPRPAENQPHLAFERLFGGGAPMDPSVTPEQVLAENKSVLDFLKGDLERLSLRVPTAERPKLDSHRDALSEIERSLETPVVSGAMVPTGIEPLPVDSSANHGKVIDNHLKIIKAAFQFDLTRVVTFSYATGNSYVETDAFGGTTGTNGAVHAITHEEAGQDSSRILEIERFYTSRTATFIQELATTPDIDGTSMLLDNTVVVFFAETSQFHEHTNIPLIVFGGQKLGIPGNRVLHYKDRWTNDLWPALAPIFGVNLPVFGDDNLNKGALPGIVV